MKQYNTIIIGFGKGGKSLVYNLATHNQSVALIEKDPKMYGGTCINVGCIPSKAINFSALKSPKADFDTRQAYYKQAIDDKIKLIRMLNQKNYEILANLESCDVIDGVASFVDDHCVLVKTKEDEFKIKGDRIIINTGAKTFIPTIKRINDNEFVFTSDTIMDHKMLPKRLTIIVGGYIGLEFASIFASFGSKVTVIDSLKQIAIREDDDIAEAIKEVLELKGIEFILDAKVTEIDGSKVHYTQNDVNGTIEGDLILVATGRIPNTKELNLENTAVEVTNHGAVVVNEFNQTTVDHIFAMGDVIGQEQFTYISFDDYRIVKSYLNNQEYSRNLRKDVPYSVSIDPSFSRVGLNEKEAKEKGLNYKVVKLPVATIPKAHILQHPVGLLKAIVDLDSGHILGAMFICEESYEIINIVKTAMDLNATYHQLRDQIFTHPTMSEALNDLFSLV